MSTSEYFSVKKGFAAILVIGLIVASLVLAGVFYMKRSTTCHSGDLLCRSIESYPETNLNSSPTTFYAVQTDLKPYTKPDNCNNFNNFELRVPSKKPVHTTVTDSNTVKSIELKFHEGTLIRLRDDHFVTLGDDDISGIEKVFAKYPNLKISRLFSRPEKELADEKIRIESESCTQLADLNLYYRVTIPTGADVEALIDDLNALRIVEIAYAAPKTTSLPLPLP